MNNYLPVQNRWTFRGSFSLVIIFVMSAMSGCYEHVIRADGAAGDFYEVRDPNYRPDDPTIIDKLLKGDLSSDSTDD